MAVEQESVVALRYVAVSVVPGTAAGSSVYAFVFHLKTSDGAVHSLSSRYSDLRKLHQGLSGDEPLRAALPKFPPKLSLQRQTPQFLIARGRDLEAYLAAVLGDTRLHSAPAVRQLLRTAEMHKPATVPAAAALSAPLSAVETRAPPATVALAPLPPAAPRRSEGLGTRMVDVAFHPLASLVLAMALGGVFNDVFLCIACCLLGLATGRVVRTTAAISHSNSSGANGAHYQNGDIALLPPPPPAAPAPVVGVPAAATPVPARSLAKGAAADGLGDALDAIAGREALVALDELAFAVRAAHEPAVAAERGWKLSQTKDGVDVYINARPDGPTWGMGHGAIDAPSAAVLAYADPTDDPTKELDKQLIKSTILRPVAASALALPDGWAIVRAQLQQNLYKSPAFPIAPRESCAVKLTVRRAADGAFRTVQRSVDVPGVAPPSGYVRVRLTCGGYDAVPRADGRGVDVTYVNILDPNGNIPRSIVNALVPDRAMIIARMRKCIVR